MRRSAPPCGAASGRRTWPCSAWPPWGPAGPWSRSPGRPPDPMPRRRLGDLVGAPILPRRNLLIAANAAALVGLAALGASQRRRRRPGPDPRVFIARGQRYDGPLAATIADGLRAVGFD